MTSDDSTDEAVLRRAAEQGDAQAMFELASRAEEQARQYLAYSHAWFERVARAGSLDAVHALVRLAVAAREYSQAQWLLQDAERRYLGEPARRFVSVAPDVLGPRLALDGDGDDEFVGAGVFSVISRYAARAAAAVARVARQLMDINEHGNIQTRDDEPTGVWDIPYTPNFLFDVQWCQYGAMVSLDTKGFMWAAMGRTMVSILVDALVADEVPAHIVGYCPDLRADFRVWKDPDDSE